MYPYPFFRLLILGSLFAACAASAQVPSVINYQGRIAVGGTNFDGTGQFKFALVSSNGSATFWSNDGSSSGGSQPAAAVPLTVAKGLYSVQLGDTTLANMTAVPAAVFTNTDVRLRVWFNDSVNGFQLLSPDQRIAAVGFAMMAATVPNGSLTGANLAAGSITAAQLAPGAAQTNLQASGQSGVASGGVVLSAQPNATNLLNAGYVRLTGFRVEGNVEKWEQGTSFPYPNPFSPAGRTNGTALWDGTEMIVWGGTQTDDAGDTSDVNTGGRYYPATDSWLPTSTNNVAPGSGHTAVWSGTDMIVWGGSLGVQGWRYNPVTDTWTAMNTNNAPPARSGHIAYYVSSNNTMIVWFGSYYDTNLDQLVFLNDGWAYSNSTWTAIGNVANTPAPRTSPLSTWDGYRIIVYGGWTNDINGNQVLLTNGARITGTNFAAGWTVMGGSYFPPGRLGGSAVTLGTNLVIWGGYTNNPLTGSNGFLNTGARYIPGAALAWTNLSASPLSPRGNHMAVSIGGKMIVWGGVGANGECFDGAIYNMTNDTWSLISTTNAPSARDSAESVWDGTEMIVWGGFDGNQVVNTGGKYNPTNNTWTNVLATLSPVGRALHSAVWTGAEMINWGGFEGEYYFNTGGRYNPALDSWTPTSTNNAPSRRAEHTAVWTGTQMLIWGGTNGFTTLNTGGRYYPAIDTWSNITTTGAPAARTLHTAVWDGTGMIVWGGNGGTNNLNTGARYNPTNDTWTTITTTGAPGPRENHTAIWDGTEMIVWGGDNATNSIYPNPLGDGARYNPTSGVWTATAALGSPSLRTGHTAIWDGTEMIVWGGTDGTNDVITGGRYNPVSNSWIKTEVSGAPFGADDVSSVWDGVEMIVWTGSNGGRYDPVSDSWRVINPPDNFSFPTENSVAWDGTRMWIFGGFDGQNYLDSIFSYTPPQIMYLYQKP